MMTPPSAHIVLFRPGALGDALLAFPTLAWLRRVWPGTRLTFVARAEVLPLAAAARLADATHAFDDPVWRALWAEHHAIEKVRQALDGASAAMAWLRDDDGAVARVLGAAGVARVIVVPGQPPAGAREHVALYLAHTLGPLELHDLPQTVADLAAALPHVISAAGEREAGILWQRWALLGTRVVALHPGSGGAAKIWPAARFAAVVSRLRHARYTPLIIEGPADQETVSQLLAWCSRENATARQPNAGGPVLVVRDLSVESLSSLLARCTGYLGNDSGVSHLAALAGCPALVLFGPTDPARWAPIGRRVRTLRGPHFDIEALDIEAVWSELQRLLPDHT